MYKDIITYELDEGVTHERLIEVASYVYIEWMKDQDGFMSWEICQQENGEYKDIVTWRDKTSAKSAENQMADIPHGSEWMACYKPSTIKSTAVETVKVFEA